MNCLSCGPYVPIRWSTVLRTVVLMTLLLFLVGEAQGQLSDLQNTLQIEGPREVADGQLVRLEARLAEDESPFWIVLSPADLDYEQVDDGRRLIFAANRKKSPITILLLAQQVREGRIATRQLRRQITIIDASPDPLPEPIPNRPGKEPAKPGFEESPLFSEVLRAAKLVSSDQARGLSEQVAKNFDRLAELCETGGIKELAKIWSTLSELNRKTLGPETARWEPVGIAMQRGFKQLKLTNVKEHGFHLRACAAALRNELNSKRMPVSKASTSGVNQ